MTTITLPSTPKFQSATWKLVQPAQNNISQWTGARQVMASNRGWWECQIVLPPIVGESNARAWLSFIGLTQGAVADFQVPVTPNGQGGGSGDPIPDLTLDFISESYVVRSDPAVNGANQTGRTLVTDGWEASTTVLYAGQYITINNQLLQLTSNVTSNGSGQATITFAPALRSSPADNALIEYLNPYALMYSVDDITYSVEPGMVYNISLNLREAF